LFLTTNSIDLNHEVSAFLGKERAKATPFLAIGLSAVLFYIPQRTHKQIRKLLIDPADRRV